MSVTSDKELKSIIHDVVQRDNDEVLCICSNYEEAVNRPDELTEKMLYDSLKIITSDVLL